MPAPLPDEQAALLRAIIANPDDDAPRLVYADWLQEHGDEEQATFIRGGITLAGMKKRAKGLAALVERLRELAEERCYDWYAPLGIPDRAAIDRYERGFPHRVTFDGAASFFASADALFAFVPIRGLEIMAHGGNEYEDGAGEFENDTLPRFGAVPGLRRLTHLWLHGHDQIADDAWGKFFRSLHLAGLTFLSLSTCGIYESEARELAKSPALAGLTELDLSYNSIGAGGLRALYESPHLKSLKTLWLDHNFFGEDPEEDVVLGLWEERLGDGLRTFEYPEDDEEEAIS
jgi:uncharacterized protein (TIGR02996 family)